jgi:hypothetical protein
VIEGAIDGAPEPLALMLRQHAQMHHGHDRTNHSTDSDLMHRAATDRGRPIVYERDANRRFFHEPRESEVVSAAVEIHRGLAEHDRAAALDFRQGGGIGLGCLAHFELEIVTPLPVSFSNQVGWIGFDLECELPLVSSGCCNRGFDCKWFSDVDGQFGNFTGASQKTTPSLAFIRERAASVDSFTQLGRVARSIGWSSAVARREQAPHVPLHLSAGG